MCVYIYIYINKYVDVYIYIFIYKIIYLFGGALHCVYNDRCGPQPTKGWGPLLQALAVQLAGYCSVRLCLASGHLPS